MASTHCSAGAYAGKSILVSVFMGCSDTRPDSANFTELGWRRGLSFQVDKETIDVTTAGSAGAFREKIQTFTEMTGSLDGVAIRSDDLKTLRRYIITTPQADAWLRFEIPDEAGAVENMYVQCMFSSYSLDGNYDSEATNDLSWEAVSVPEFVDVPA